MAKVKIQGHASGTGILTVTAPNTSTDRTITLPDATGTLLATEGAVVINDSGADVDFRVESDTDANSLFVQGSDGNVGIGEAAPATAIEVTTTAPYLTLHNSTNEDSDGGRESKIVFKGHRANATETTLATIIASHPGTGNDYNGELLLQTNNHTVGADTMTTSLHLTGDGRGVSQFTAKAWINFDGYVTTPNIRDSHNISSITDNGTGLYTVNFTNNMANANYCVAGLAAGHDTGASLSRDLYHKGYDALATGGFGLQVLRDYDANTEDGKLITAVVFGD